MKTKAFQTKRKPMKGFRTLYAKTRKRKQRVSAAAAGGDFAVEEPNLGVARALVVILILHVAAIVAIVVHSSSTNDNGMAVRDSPAVKPADKANVVVKAKQVAQPKIAPTDRWEYVQRGDTYERFARRHQVDVQELRRLNNSTPLKYGLAMILPEPALQSTHQVPAAMARVSQDTIIQETLPEIVDVPTRFHIPAEYEVVEAPQPVKVTAEPFPEFEEETLVPAVHHQVAQPLLVVEPAPVPEVIEQAQPEPVPAPEPKKIAPPKPSMKSYTIRKGDTLWAIANRNGISVDKLMSANRNVNPKKMKLGAKIKIPAR